MEPHTAITATTTTTTTINMVSIISFMIGVSIAIIFRKICNDRKCLLVRTN